MIIFRFFFRTTCLIGLFISSASAISEQHLAVKFYKSPQSAFCSGEINRRELEKNWVEDQDEFSYLVQNGKKQMWVKADWIATDLHLSQTVYSPKNSHTYRVLKTDGSHILGETEDKKEGQKEGKKTVEWLSLKDLTPLPEDMGLAMTLTSTNLRTHPTWKSDSMMTLSAQTRLKILKIEDTWVQVEFEAVGKVSGWVDLNNLLTKYDFASFAMTSDDKWIPLSHREGSHLIVAGPHTGQKIPLAKIKGLLTKADLGISLVSEDSKNLLLRQNLSILKIDNEKWSLSRLEGHGLVYWKKSPTASKETIWNGLTNSSSPDGLSTEELLRREITSVSFHPQNPNMGLASSQGIFLTLDGKFWRQLPIFKNQSHAVLIDSQSVLYVGSQRSFDLGKTFSPFLRWESLSQLLETKHRRPSNQMRISQLSIPRPGVLQMEVETDLGKLKVAARNSIETLTKWDFN